MVGLGLVCAALVATVLAVSGVAKLLDLAGTRDAVEALGVPRALRAPVAALLGPVELVLAALLIPPATGTFAAAGAAVLLVAFSAVVLLNLRAGRRPRCGCFGGLGSSDVSGRTVARNLVLLLAALLAITPREEIAVGPVALGGLLGAAVVAGEQLLARRAGEAREHADEADQASLDEEERRPAPPFTLPTLSGTPLSLDDLLARGHPLLLVFLTPSCGSCRTLLPSVVRWHSSFRARLTVAAVASGNPERSAEVLGDHGALTLLLAPNHDVTGRYELAGSPGAVLIAQDGRITSPAAAGATGVRRLLARALDADTEAAPRCRPEDVELRSRPAPAPAVSIEEDDDATQLVDEVTGAHVTLDPLGALVWQCFDGRSSLTEIAVDLADVFSADADAVAADVLRVAQVCAEAGLLTITRQPSEEVVPAAAAGR